MSEKARYHTDPHKIELLIKTKEMDLEAGWLGKIFGAGNKAASNIAGLLVTLLTVSGFFVLFIESSVSALEYWKTITPIITLALGYIFGKGVS